MKGLNCINNDINNDIIMDNYTIYVNDVKYADEVIGHQRLIEYIEQIKVERGEGAYYKITLFKK